METQYRNPNHLITDIRPLAEAIAKENNSKLTGITIGTVAVQLRFAYNLGGNQWEMLFYHNNYPACSIVIYYLRQKCKNEDTIYGRTVAMVNRYYSLPVDCRPEPSETDQMDGSISAFIQADIDATEQFKMISSSLAPKPDNESQRLMDKQNAEMLEHFEKWLSSNNG